MRQSLGGGPGLFSHGLKGGAVRYRVELEGFEKQTIEVEPPRMFGGASIHVDGATVLRRRGRHYLTRDDGREVAVTVKPSLFYDAPALEVDGQRIHIVEPLPWYQYLLSSVPLVLVVLGGIVGAFVAIALIMANVQTFRSERSTAAKYARVCLLSVGVPLAWIAVAAILAATDAI